MLSGWPSIASWAMPAALQKRLVKFLLKRAVGQFLRDELDLDHLDVQLGQGVVQLRELALNVQIFNEITTDLPFNVVDGRIGGITVTIPWKNIWQGDCQLEIHDFLLVVEVKGPENNEQLVGVDMASSHLMASSIHFADDFLRHEIPQAASTMSDNNGNSNSNSNSNDGGDLHGMEKELHQSLMSSVYAMAREGSTLSHITATDSDAASSSIMLDNNGGTPPAVDDTGMEGLQVLAGLIERLISRVKVMIHNTRLRLLVHPPVDSSSSSSSSSTNLNNELLNSDVTKTTEALDHWLRSTMGAKGNDYADILSEAILSRIHPEETGHTTTNPTDQSAEPASTNPGDIAEDKGPTVTVIELDVPVITLMEYNADTDSSSETDSSTANLPGHVMKSLLFNGVHIWLRELYGTGLEDVVTSSSSPSSSTSSSTMDKNADRVKSASLIGMLVDHDHTIQCSLKRSTLSMPSQWSLEGVLDALCIMITPQHARVLLLLLHQIETYKNSRVKSQSSNAYSLPITTAIHRQSASKTRTSGKGTAAATSTTNYASNMVHPTTSIPSTPSSINDTWSGDLYFSMAERGDGMYNDGDDVIHKSTQDYFTSSGQSSIGNMDDKEARISQWAIETTHTTRPQSRVISNSGRRESNTTNMDEEESIWVDLFQPMSSPSSVTSEKRAYPPIPSSMLNAEATSESLTSKMILDDLITMASDDTRESVHRSRQHPALQFNQPQSPSNTTISLDRPTFADNSSIPPLSLQSRADETKDSLIGCVQLSILELNLFLMLDESSISSSTCLDNNEASEEKKDRIDRLYQLLTKESHMKWSMNQISILWQCFHCLNNSRQHRSRRSNTSRQQQHHHRQSINYRSRNTTGPVIPQRSTLDVKVQQIQLLVWLMNQMDTASSTSMPDSTDDSPLMADSRPSVFEQYQCILSFSNDLLANYRDNNGFDENTDEGDNDLTENVLLCHMEQNNGQDCINIKTQPILLTIDLRQLEQLKLYFEMSQFYQQLSSIPLDTYRATPEMENSLDISFDTEYRMKSHKRGQIDTMAQCVFDDLSQPSFSNPSHLSTTRNRNGTMQRNQTTLSWTTPLIRIDVGVPDGLRKELPTMNHLVESLQFDILQSRLHSPSDEAALLGEIALNNPITSNSTTATPSAPSSTNRRNHHKTGATKMTSTSSDDTDRIRWSCDAIHGFINDRSCQYKSTHFLSISSSNDQSPMIDVTLRAKSAFDTYSGISRSNNPSTVDPAEGVQQIFTVYEGDERIRVQMVEDEDQLYFKQRSLEHSLVVVDVQLPKIDVTVTKAVYDSLITMGAHLSVWELDRVLGTSSSTTHNTERDHGKFNQSSSYYKSNHSASAPLDLSNLEQSYLEHASMTSEVSSVYYEARSTTSGLNNDGGENRATSPVIHPMASMLRIGHVTVNLLCDIPMMASVSSSTMETESRNTRSDYDIKETESSISSSSQCSEAVGYRIQLTQLDFFTLKQAMGKHVVLASGETFFMAHELSDGTQTTFLFRDQSVTPLSSKPAFSLSIQTTIIPDINQIQNVLFNLTVNDVVLRVTPNMQHLALLADWMASPQGLPQVDNVKRYIQATISLNDLCLDYKTPTSAARAAFTLESIKISTHIQPDMHTLELKTITKDTKLWIVEDATTLLSDQGLEYHVNLYSPAYWKAIGYVQVASLDYLDVTLSLSLSQPVPFVQVEMSNHLLAFDTCADSTQTLEHLVQDLGSHFKSESSQEDTTLEDELDGIQMDEPSTSNTIEELLADLEQDTFTAKKSTTSSSSIHVTRPSQEWQFTSEKGNESEDEQIYSLEDEELLMVEDHFSALSATVIASTMPTSSETPKSHRQSLPGTRFRLHLSDFHVTWRLHGGFDWEVHRREAAVAAALGKERQRQRNEEQKQQQQQQQASTLSTSINDATATYTGDIVQESMSDTSDTISETFTEVTQVPLFDSDAENDGSDARYLLRTYGRSKSAKLEVKLMYITVEAEVYEPDQRDAFRVRLGVRDVEIIDHIRTSVWNKFLTAMRSDGQSAPRESSSSMIRVDLTSVRPDPVKYKHREELRVKIRILPLRFHIDQDALNFAIQFFKIDELLAPSRATLDVNEQTKPTTPVHRSDRPYFERFELKPMMMKIDYKPKKFGLSSLREGQFLELMNVFQLDGSEITLRQVKLTGISGIHRLVDAIQATWLPHIGYTQVSNFVSGVAPIRSMVNIGSGMADLVLLPIEQYRKDGRIIRGLQRGLQSFTKSTAMEAIKLGTKLAVGTQVLLEHADDILSFDGPNTLLSASPPNSNSSTSSSITAMPGAAAMARQSSLGHSQWREDPLEGPSSIGGGGSSNTNTNTRSGHYSSSSTTTTRHGNTTSLRDNPTLTSTSKYGEQPTSFNEGIELAYDSMRRNVGTAAHTIFAVPMEVYERTGTQGSVKAVIRAVPVAVLRPMIGASEAFSKALMGLRNTIDPTQKLQMEDKYKSGRQ